MTATDLEAVQVVTGDQIADITRDVWSSFLGLDLEPLEGVPVTGRTATGCVHVSGEWNGSVFLECTVEHARAAAAAMFMAEPDSLGDDEVGDALGELTNMVGGNVKSLLPEPSRLSIPSVVLGEGCSVRVPGATLVEEVTLVGPAGPVHISVWEV